MRVLAKKELGIKQLSDVSIEDLEARLGEELEDREEMDFCLIFWGD